MDTHGTKFKSSGDEEVLIDTKLGGVLSTDNGLQPSKIIPLVYGIMGTGQLIMR